MNGLEPTHLCLVLAVVWLTVATGYTIQDESRLIIPGKDEQQAGKVRILRSSRHKKLGFPSVTLGRDSLGRRLDRSQQTTAQVDYKEVKSSDVHVSHQDVVLISQGKKFSDNHRVVRAENSIHKDDDNIGQLAALSQEVSKSDLVTSIPKMVIVVSTTIAALFGMCVMAAIFQCCCRKKRSSSDSDTGDVVKNEKEEKQRSKSPSPVKDGIKPQPPEENTENDKLLEDDDLGDFSVVQRETEILKSYRKPPPPKNRARASRVPRMKAAAAAQSKEEGFSLIKEDTEGSIKSKPGSQRSTPEKPVVPRDTVSELNEKTDHNEPDKTEDKRLSFESAKQLVDSMLAEVREKGERTLVAESQESAKETDQEERVEASAMNGLHSTSGNIFMQIDPTVRVEDPNEKKSSKIPVKASSSPSSPGSSLRPTSANKDQRKFLVPSVHGEHMDQLVKSLKSRLKEDKSQSARNLATNKVVPSPSEEDLDPKNRERSHSDPTKNLLGLKSTHV